MKKKDVEVIKQSLSILIGQPLRSFDRAGSLVILEIGELVKKDICYKDENGKLARDEKGKLLQKEGFVGKYTLRIVCGVRLTCDNEVVFSQSDIYLPNTKLLYTNLIEGGDFDGCFDWDNFEWRIRGNNFFDEMVAKYFGAEPFEFIVKEIKVSRLGDLTIVFENGFILDVFANSSRESDNWVFYDAITEKNILIITGEGIAVDDEELSVE